MKLTRIQALRSTRRTAQVLITFGLLLFTAPALAGSMVFAELLTSDQSVLGANYRATLEAGDFSGDAADIMLDGDVTAGAGIGDGYVAGLGEYVMFTHTFTPSAAYTAVTGAHLVVALRDDAFLDGRESASIELGGDSWKRGSASWISLFGGNVSAYFVNNEDELSVAVIGRRGDFIVDSSLLVWKFATDSGGPSAGTGAQPVPEPTGLALFCVGAVVLRRATRRSA